MILKRFIVGVATFAAVTVPASGQSARKLDISFDAGKVTIAAENVSLRDIMAEWSRKGGSRIVNAELLPATPILMMAFDNQPEADVMRALLRDAPGYGAAMRTEAPAGGSTIQTVFILAVRATTATNSPASAINQPIQQPQPQPQGAPRMLQGTPDDEIPPVRPLVGDQPPTTPGGTPQPSNPNLRVGPGGTVTSTVPGVIIPAPTPAPGAKPPVPGRGGGGGGH